MDDTKRLHAGLKKIAKEAENEEEGVFIGYDKVRKEYHISSMRTSFTGGVTIFDAIKKMGDLPEDY